VPNPFSFGLWGIIMYSAQPCVAPNPIIWVLGDYYGLSATLHCAESYYLGSEGLFWIERNLALRRILSFGLWGIILD
jgi:hypothetical protein